MDDSWPSRKLLDDLSEENYDHTFSAYRFWIKVGAARGGVLNDQLYNDILSSTRPDLVTTPWWERDASSYAYTARYTARGQLIHSSVHLLLRFITDAEQDPVLSTYAIGLHHRLCRESLDQFFRQCLDYTPGRWGEPTKEQLREFYTRVNLIAHWVNLGYVKLEDVRDHILQSLTFQRTAHPYKLHSLMILLKISGATFAAHVDPLVLDHCCYLLEQSDRDKVVLTELAEVRAPILMIKINYEC